MKKLILSGIILAIIGIFFPAIYGLLFVDPAKPETKIETLELADVVPKAEAKQTKTNATGTEEFPTGIFDLTKDQTGKTRGVCYKLNDQDGQGFTYIWAKNGALFSGLTCE